MIQVGKYHRVELGQKKALSKTELTRLGEIKRRREGDLTWEMRTGTSFYPLYGLGLSLLMNKQEIRDGIRTRYSMPRALS